MITLRAALPAVCIEKQLEPSHSLLDLVSQQFEAQQLAYLSPDRCTSREWEVAMGKTSKQIQLDTDHLVVKEKSDTPDQVAATEMQISEALRRRGVAYAFADLLEWTVHERYITQLFGHLRKDPPQGYVKTSIQQLLRADRAVWAKIIEGNVSVRRDATGQRPLMQQYLPLFTALRLPSTWSRCRNQFMHQRMNGRPSSGEKMMNGRTSSGINGSLMIPRKPKGRAKVSDPTWRRRPSSTRIA